MLAALLISACTFAQTITQTVRGTVTDKISQSPLPGATVILLNSEPLRAVATDAEGKFSLEKVPVGKQSLKFVFLGYKEVLMQNLSVNSGKELVLNVGMEEDIQKMEEVQVTAKFEKNKALNDMSVVSTRTFSVEETQKFAAAVNDPGRMATSFAGVVSAGDGNNIISVRGNSPNGLLWRMEGVEIPNPNHFSNVGTSGGGISILSAQLLSNSDFSTGAFAAEYGNALSGVFDLKLRKGNNQKREYTFQLGLLGADIASEGPFSKKYDGSYLVNYRYSTLSMLSKVGVQIGDASTNFQDLSFNVSLPTKKAGNFTVFGFGGLSSQKTFAKKDTAAWSKDEFTRYTSNYFANTGAVGLTHTKLFGNKSYLKSALVFSGTQNGYYQEKLQDDLNTFKREFDNNFTQGKITLSSVFTHKINARNNLRTGIILNQLAYNFLYKHTDTANVYRTAIDVSGSTQSAQAFFQYNHKFGTKLTANAGLHYLQLMLNNTHSVEPRASLRYELHPRHNFTFGYGMHGQIQPLGTYFAQIQNDKGEIVRPNKNLGISKAQHFVFGYDWSINSFSHIKTEVYGQLLSNIPISRDPLSTYSIINAYDGYNTDPLVNAGRGINKGIELTYERFLHKNLYYLVCGSLFDSKYKAPDGNWYNTFFNTNYVLTVTLGKEWPLKNQKKNRVLGFNFKSMYIGGYRNTPIDLKASIASGEEVSEARKAFAHKNPDYYRLDIRISLKRNFAKVTSTVALDIQNTTNRKNVGGQYFDKKTAGIKYWYQTPLIPILSYRLEF